MSEHHSTPLNLTPSPSVFLAAVAQRTKRIRLGALVYVLPAHHPLRLAEEICMLDHLSHGRLEVGIGRGASPHELDYFGVDAGFGAGDLCRGLSGHHAGADAGRGQFRRQALSVRESTDRYEARATAASAAWYAVPVPEGAAWPAQNAINIVCGGPLPRVREITDRFRAEWAAAGNPPEQLPLMGINRFVIAADSDREAMALGRRAWPSFHTSFMKLWKLHGTQPRFARLPEDFDTLVAERRRDCGLARHDCRQDPRHDRRGRRELFHQPVLLRRSHPGGGAAFRRHLRARNDAAREARGASGLERCMSDGLTKSARRVFDILELFRERQCPLRLKDVVDSLGMPTSSAAALLKTMAQMNYLSFESTSRAYLPTLRLLQLGSWVTSANYEGGPIQEAVRRIGRKLGETILLGTLTDIYVEIVDILRARQPLQYYTHVGTRVLLGAFRPRLAAAQRTRRR